LGFATTRVRRYARDVHSKPTVRVRNSSATSSLISGCSPVASIETSPFAPPQMNQLPLRPLSTSHTRERLIRARLPRLNASTFRLGVSLLGEWRPISRGPGQNQDVFVLGSRSSCRRRPPCRPGIARTARTAGRSASKSRPVRHKSRLIANLKIKRRVPVMCRPARGGGIRQ